MSKAVLLVASVLTAGVSLVAPASSAQTLTALYSFTGGAAGAGPWSSLIEDNGVLYGTTSGVLYGGVMPNDTVGQGTVFKLDIATGTETLLHSFVGGVDGANPFGGLIDEKGLLYGTTYAGGGTGCGGGGCGTVFSVSAASGKEKILYSFLGKPDGQNPESTLISVAGTLYGTTYGGGSSGSGTVFTINPATGAETVLYSFKGGTDGAAPAAGLIYVNKTLYGTTYAGGGTGCGGNGCGTVFSIAIAGGKEKVLYSFLGNPDGQNPEAALTNVAGALYGTTNAGGSSGYGTVFSINPKSRAERVLYSFSNGSDGGNPIAGLVYQGGFLYGTAPGNNTGSGGAIFKVDPATSAETNLYTFSFFSADGFDPIGGLIVKKGVIYGTTDEGGNSGDLSCEAFGFNVSCGVVFKFVP